MLSPKQANELLEELLEDMDAIKVIVMFIDKGGSMFIMGSGIDGYAHASNVPMLKKALELETAREKQNAPVNKLPI